MILRETCAILLIINTNTHAHERWLASFKREAIPTKYFHGTAIYVAKCLGGQVLEWPHVNAALDWRIS